MDHDLDVLLRALEGAGCHVAFRESGWWECLLVCGDAHVGRGLDRDAALRDALRVALPTGLARKAFERLLTASSPRASRRPPPAPEAPAPAAEATTPGVPASPPPTAPAEPPSTAAQEPPPPPAPSAPAAPEASPPSAPTPPAASDATPDEPPPPKPTAKEVLAEIKAMRKQIETDAEELALASPRRQRLVLLGWITRARAAQMQYPDDARIDAAVAAMARTLTGYCQTWWPGSVRSLKVTTRPEDIVHDLTIQVGQPPRTWTDAVEVVDRNVRFIEEEDEARGRDGYGWADVSRLEPPPRDADAMLEEMIAGAELLSGPIDGPATDTKVPEAAQFLEWARKLRWARETTGNPGRWGLLNGRFRFWIREHGGRFPEVSRTLDAEWCPDRSWAALLGLDPETQRRNREIRELFLSPPVPEQNPDAATLVAWLARALVYSDTHLTQVITAMQPFRDALLAMDADKLPNADRRMRRRFSKLQKELSTPDIIASLPPPAIIEPEAPPSASDPVSDMAAIPAELRDAILPYTRDKRALFVSNRADPNLRQRLQEVFGFADLDWSAGETKRRQALVTPIQTGTYDFVLGATGFLSHSIDGQIAVACRKGNVRYVRVHRGRPLACLRAMARELGLEAHSGHRATLHPAASDD